MGYFKKLVLVISLVSYVVHAWAIEDDACDNDKIIRTTPSSDFEVIDDGSIVLHKRTGLEWQRCAVGQVWTGSSCSGTPSTSNWQGALNGANAQEGWRLPNINELRSIVEECRNSPSINQKVFPNTPTPTYAFWSSTPALKTESNLTAWYFYFDVNNTNGKNTKGSQGMVRYVRDGQ